MAKKQTTTILLLAGAAAAAYFFMKKKNTEDSTESKDSGEGTETTKADAVVTAPAGNFQAALNTAKDIATNLKDAAILVKSGNKTALVKKGTKKKKKVKCPKLTKDQLDKMCEGLTGKAARACRKKNKRSCFTFPPTESSFKPFTDQQDPATDEDK